jgi:hypothetical protein
MYLLNNKTSIVDLLKSHNYINPALSVEYHTDPFHYIIIRNMFKQEIYESLCDRFLTYIGRTTPYKDQPGAVHDYAGYIYGFNKSDCVNGYDFFIDPTWKNFCSQTFNIDTNKYVALSAHWHKAPSQHGFVHRDLNICSGSITNDDNITLTGDCYYSDDSIDMQPNTVKFIRSLAGLFYLRNKEPLEPQDKGGTSIYSNWNISSKIKDIQPENNSLFMFEVCPRSFHGFSGANFDRSAVVHWFHSSPAYLLRRHFDEVKFYSQKFNAPYERWNPKNNPWPIENDPLYFQYFNTTFKESLQ